MADRDTYVWRAERILAEALRASVYNMAREVVFWLAVELNDVTCHV